MSDEERRALLDKMQASIEKAKSMTREQARARLADEERRLNQALTEAFGERALAQG